MSGAQDRHDAEAREAQAQLDQLRAQAGGALSGEEVARRSGVDPDEGLNDPPPLDWRLTPRNVILQLGAIALFAAVVWFFYALVRDSLAILFG